MTTPSVKLTRKGVQTYSVPASVRRPRSDARDRRPPGRPEPAGPDRQSRDMEYGARVHLNVKFDTSRQSRQAFDVKPDWQKG